MALKKIKFNLIVDGERCRKIEDIQNNFNILDLLDYYKNKKLHKWLKVRKFDDYFYKIDGIKVDDDFEIAKKLCEIFEIECEDEDIKSELLSGVKEEIIKKNEVNKNILNKIESIVKIDDEMLKAMEVFIDPSKLKNYDFYKLAIGYISSSALEKLKNDYIIPKEFLLFMIDTGNSDYLRADKLKTPFLKGINKKMVKKIGKKILYFFDLTGKLKDYNFPKIDDITLEKEKIQETYCYKFIKDM